MTSHYYLVAFAVEYVNIKCFAVKAMYFKVKSCRSTSLY